MKKKVPKSVPIIIVVVLTVLVLGGIRYRYTLSKSKNVEYTVQKYLSSGIFNKYKLYTINNLTLSFSDGTLAIVNVTGLRNKSPHKNVAYKIFLEKRKNGSWKVEKVYTE